MKTPEEQDPTWELLLKSKSQQPGASFVRNVVREARKLEGSESGLMVVFAWLKRPVIAVPVAIGAAAILFSTLTLIQSPAPSSPGANSTAVATVDDQNAATSVTSLPKITDIVSDLTEDLEMIDYMGELVAITDPAELDDAALADLFF